MGCEIEKIEAIFFSCAIIESSSGLVRIPEIHYFLCNSISRRWGRGEIRGEEKRRPAVFPNYTNCRLMIIRQSSSPSSFFRALAWFAWSTAHGPKTCNSHRPGDRLSSRANGACHYPPRARPFRNSLPPPYAISRCAAPRQQRRQR